MQSIERAGYTPGADIAIGVDVAASELYKDGVYHFASEQRDHTVDSLVEWYRDITQKYPVISIEDGLSEDDWNGWKQLHDTLPKTQLVGDDLLVTNTTRLKIAIDEDVANAILIKPNQIGTLTETIRAIQLAKQHNWNTIVSHRSGETEDVTIAHIAIGTGAGQIKTGSVSRSERVAKYNELMRLESLDTSLQLARPF
jgi:enolase